MRLLARSYPFLPLGRDHGTMSPPMKTAREIATLKIADRAGNDPRRSPVHCVGHANSNIRYLVECVHMCLTVCRTALYVDGAVSSHGRRDHHHGAWAWQGHG